MSGWSNTTYRGGNSNGGYIPGSDSNISSGLSGTSTRDVFDHVDVTYNIPYIHNTGNYKKSKFF